MSCKHGNPDGACDLCDEVDAAFEQGRESMRKKCIRICQEVVDFFEDCTELHPLNKRELETAEDFIHRFKEIQGDQMSFEAGRESRYPLPDNLYPGSKDWIAGDYAERVGWLHSMYESKKQEVESLLQQIEMAHESSDDLVEAVETLLSVIDSGVVDISPDLVSVIRVRRHLKELK